ncbi:MAG: hypothetical protein JST89_17045 [Cyanobacteria bacterium SZAS-4]|nr:hypothetical protein [Cyanobacteria bacterium SZAS-4]
MKPRLLISVITVVQILAPSAALSDDDSKWASGRDGFQDFCDSISKGFSGMAKTLTGGSAPTGDDATYGSRRGAWDSIFPAAPPPNQEIVYTEGNRKVLDSKNVVIRGTDGSRISHRTAHNAGFATPLKKMIDGGGSSYRASVSSGAGSSHYYAMGSGIRGGGHSGWGSYGESAGSRLGGSTRYGFGMAAEGPKMTGAWGGTGSSAGGSSAGASRGYGYR